MTVDLFDVMRTWRAMRRFEDRDVPDEVIAELLDLAIRAPSASNSQCWSFIVVRDRETMSELGVEIGKGTRWKSGLQESLLDEASRSGVMSAEDVARSRRSAKAFKDLAEQFSTVPVAICVCAEQDPSTKGAVSWGSVRMLVHEYGIGGLVRFLGAASRAKAQARWASVYPAVQNLLLAARGLGLGAVLTTPQLLGPPGRFERILGIPKGVDIAAIVPIGYPKGRFGPVRRLPAKMFKDRYGQD